MPTGRAATTLGLIMQATHTQPVGTPYTPCSSTKLTVLTSLPRGASVRRQGLLFELSRSHASPTCGLVAASMTQGSMPADRQPLPTLAHGSCP